MDLVPTVITASRHYLPPELLNTVQLLGILIEQCSQNKQEFTPTWVNPSMRSFWHPMQRAQFSFYLNAACANKDGSVDEQVVARLRLLLSEFPVGAKSIVGRGK